MTVDANKAVHFDDTRLLHLFSEMENLKIIQRVCWLISFPFTRGWSRHTNVKIIVIQAMADVSLWYFY